MQHALENMQGQKLSLHISFQLYAKGAPRPYPRRARPPFVGFADISPAERGNQPFTLSPPGDSGTVAY